jgi:PqqD family protein of HPr-rel-A system
MANSLSKMTWQLSQGCQFQWRSWSDEHVVYNEASGDTHLLDTITASALRNLQEQPASFIELKERLASSLSLDNTEELSAYLNEVLSNLRRLDLIERR